MLTRIDELHKCVIGNKYDAPSFMNLPVNPSIPAALDGLKVSNNFKIISSSIQFNLFFLIPIQMNNNMQK